MKHIKVYEELSLWTKELVGANSRVLVSVNKEFFTPNDLEKNIAIILKDVEKIFSNFGLDIVDLSFDTNKKWRFNTYILDGIIDKNDLESYLTLYDRTKMACVRISFIGPDSEVEIGDELYLVWTPEEGLRKLH